MRNVTSFIPKTLILDGSNDCIDKKDELLFEKCGSYTGIESSSGELFTLRGIDQNNPNTCPDMLRCPETKAAEPLTSLCIQMRHFKLCPEEDRLCRTTCGAATK